MELLDPVEPEAAVALHRRLAGSDPELRDAAALIAQVHAEAAGVLPFLGPVDDNPANVMRAADGGLRVTDLSYADGPRLYRTVREDPDTIVRAFPPEARRHMLDLPMAGNGPWPEGDRARTAVLLADADAALAGSAP